jgi:uncharacterized protein
MIRFVVLLTLAVTMAAAQPKRVLYFSHTAGFRHGSIETARNVLRAIAPGRIEVTASEDLAMISADRLRGFDAVFFYTSGELALSATQKRDLLDFVRNGGGFAGAHSATDTLYTWPEYGELIGGYFDGHPWTKEVRIDLEDPDHPATRGLPASFPLVEEVYQFRAFDRNRVRVLLTLDTRTVDLTANGVNRRDEDFALAWVHQYGRGRVFYTALGHFDEVFLDAHVQRMLRQALEWITGLTDGEATPRGAVTKPAIAAFGEAAQLGHRDTLAPGSLVTIYGQNLTSGSSLAGGDAMRLAGTSVLLNGAAVNIIYASPTQINLRLPLDLPADPRLQVRSGIVTSDAARARLAPTTPGIFTATYPASAITLWCTGLGAVDARGLTRLTPTVTVNGVNAEVLYSGLAPGFPGLYQVNVSRAPSPILATEIRLEIGGASALIRLP